MRKKIDKFESFSVFFSTLQYFAVHLQLLISTGPVQLSYITKSFWVRRFWEAVFFQTDIMCTENMFAASKKTRKKWWLEISAMLYFYWVYHNYVPTRNIGRRRRRGYWKKFRISPNVAILQWHCCYFPFLSGEDLQSSLFNCKKSGNSKLHF